MSNEYGRFSEEQIAAWLKERAEARFFIKAFPVSVKVMDDEKRVLRVAISDERRDRDGDIVRQLGLDTSEYAQNPIVFMGRGPMHANSGFPIARSLKVFRKYQGSMLTTFSDDMFAGDEQRHDEAELAYRLARDGFLNTTSIGFSPRVVKDLPDDALTDDEKAARDAGKWVRGYDIRRSIKYEHTWVGIPSNIGATVQRDLEKIGIKAGDRTVADFVDVARQFLKGAKLDTFRNALIGERELITIGAFSVEKAPAAYRASLAKSLDSDEGVPDEGFDAWEQWIGVKCPDAGDVVIAKSAPDSVPVPDVEVEPAPVSDKAADDESTKSAMEIQTLIFSKTKFPKRADATKWAKDHDFKSDSVDETENSWRLRQFDPGLCEAGGERTITITAGIKAGVCKRSDESGDGKSDEPEVVKEADQKPLDSVELERLVRDQKSVIETLTKRLTDLEFPSVSEVPTPAAIDVAALADRFEKSLLESVAATTKAVADSEARTARLIEDALIELELHKDNEIFAAKRGTIPSRDATSDPAPVVKDVPPPAAVTPPASVGVVKAVSVAQPTEVHLDPQMVASLVPALAKALNIEGIVEQVIYRHRGGITLPQGG